MIVVWSPPSGLLSGCPNQEGGWLFLFKGRIIGTSSYLGADSATKKTLLQCNHFRFRWQNQHQSNNSSNILETFEKEWSSYFLITGATTKGTVQCTAAIFYWLPRPSKRMNNPVRQNWMMETQSKVGLQGIVVQALGEGARGLFLCTIRMLLYTIRILYF